MGWNSDHTRMKSSGCGKFFSTVERQKPKSKLVMKNITTFALMSAFASVAATAAVTDPVGYVTHTVTSGVFNLVGPTVHQPKAVASSFDDTSGGTALVDSTTDFDAVLTAGTTYVLQITSGAASGLVQEVTSWSGNTINTPQDLTTLGLLDDDAYQVRKASTLSDLFGAANEAGLQEGDITTADVIWVPTGSGAFAKFYYSPAVVFPPAAAGWKTSGGADAANQPIVYTDSIFIERRGAGPLDIVLTGEVELNDTALYLENGVFNYVSNVFPVGSTLGNSGLENSVLEGDITTADVVWLPDGAGGYAKYYYSPEVVFPPAAAGWKTSGGADATNTPLTSGFIIERRGTTDTAPISPPPYSL